MYFVEYLIVKLNDKVHDIINLVYVKKHFTHIELNKFQPITPLSYKSSHLPSNIEEKKITCKRRNLNQLRRSQAISQLCHIDF